MQSLKVVSFWLVSDCTQLCRPHLVRTSQLVGPAVVFCMCFCFTVIRVLLKDTEGLECEVPTSKQIHLWAMSATYNV